MFVYNVCLQYVLDMFVYNICVQILQEHISGNSINDMSGTQHPYCCIQSMKCQEHNIHTVVFTLTNEIVDSIDEIMFHV